MSDEATAHDPARDATRDIADVAAVEVIVTAAVHLMSAAAVKCGLAEDGPDGDGRQYLDLDEARKLITALAAAGCALTLSVGAANAATIPLERHRNHVPLGRYCAMLPDVYARQQLRT